MGPKRNYCGAYGQALKCQALKSSPKEFLLRYGVRSLGVELNPPVFGPWVAGHGSVGCMAMGGF